MKKTYSKPEIVYECFSVSTSIAGDCERIVGNPSKGSCGVPGSMPNMNIFSSTVTGADGCQVWNDADSHDGFCYHIPDSSYTLFNS